MTKDSMKKIVSLPAHTYVNTTPVCTMAGVQLYLWDVVKADLSARLNLGLYGGAGMGKSQLLADVQGLFGNNSSYVLGRNDLDIKSLYRQLNFRKLSDAMNQGGTVSQRELTEVTSEIHKPLTVVEEINRCAEIVQNQLFNIFEGYIEMDGKKYPLGNDKTAKFRDVDGKEHSENVNYGVGVWSANFGNGGFSGTVGMDDALKDRSHMIIDVDNFSPGRLNATDLDSILLGSAGEVRLKEQEKPEDATSAFIDAFTYLKQKSKTPEPVEHGEELLLFRYLTLGLDYIPCEAADNSKRAMKDVWPAKAEEDSIGVNEDEKTMYRMVYPSSVSGALSVMNLARALREYTKAKDPRAKPTVLESVIESFKLVAAYSGVIKNQQKLTEEYIGNPYKAACAITKIIQEKLESRKNLMQAISYCKAEEKPLPKKVLDECTGEFACWR